MSEAPSLKFTNCSCAACLVFSCDTKHGCDCFIGRGSTDKLKLKTGGVEKFETKVYAFTEKNINRGIDRIIKRYNIDEADAMELRELCKSLHYFEEEKEC